MEHRLSERTVLNTHVAIYYNSLGLLQAQAINLSRHGMFVKTGRLSLPLHALIEVAFPVDGKHKQPIRTKAMVVRVTHNGIGLMFGTDLEEENASENTYALDDNQLYQACAS